MTSDAANPERERTDESLRAERTKTDRALTDQRAVQDQADAEVDRIRDRADESVSVARDEADRAGRAKASPVVPAVIAAQRVREDNALRNERAVTNEAFRREREESARALANLLPHERENTDRDLLTERLRSDDALANRDDFLGMVSHDLRNLLGGIVMSTNLLSKVAFEAAEKEQVNAWTKSIYVYAARMNRLIGDLVDVASIDAGRLAMELTGGNPSALVIEAADMFRDAAAMKGVTLEVDVIDRSAAAEFDRERLIQVLTNLISNAIKFTPAGGKVMVRAERTKTELRFRVSDTGIGVPDHMLESIFERFWQVGKDDRRGVGLGLYICRRIVEAHGGRIWAESAPGEGTVLSFTLPAKDGHVDAGAENAVASRSSAAARR